MIGGCTPETIADIGAGDGVLSQFLRTLFPKSLIIAIDVSISGLKKLDGRSEICRIVADAKNLPLRDQTVSLLCALELIEHFDNQEEHAFLSEIWRVTVDQGTLLLSTPNNQSLTNMTGRILFRMLGQKWTAGDPTHKRIYTIEEIRNSLENEKFRVSNLRTVWFAPSGISFIGQKLSSLRIVFVTWLKLNLKMSDWRLIKRAGHIIVLRATRS